MSPIRAALTGNSKSRLARRSSSRIPNSRSFTRNDAAAVRSWLVVHHECVDPSGATKRQSPPSSSHWTLRRPSSAGPFGVIAIATVKAASPTKRARLVVVALSISKTPQGRSMSIFLVVGVFVFSPPPSSSLLLAASRCGVVDIATSPSASSSLSRAALLFADDDANCASRTISSRSPALRPNNSWSNTSRFRSPFSPSARSTP
mmetsp:Transcript_19022/g.61244  ORF Transcript_19022/g.61244 Transcript_19022/m.61244 type:complete len:204 (-) Transcript_19022:230-841(-)